MFPKIFPDEVIDFVFGGPEPFAFGLSYSQHVPPYEEEAAGYVDVEFATNEGPEENHYMVRILVKPEPNVRIIRTASYPRRKP